MRQVRQFNLTVGVRVIEGFMIVGVGVKEISGVEVGVRVAVGVAVGQTNIGLQLPVVPGDWFPVQFPLT